MTFRQVKVPAMLGVTLLLAVGGCTSVFETAQAPLGRGLACESAMGGYYLPKSLVHMKVSAAPADTKQRGFVVEAGSFTQDWIADRQQLFCLDYLALPNSVDNITASRDQRGLLVEVTSTVTDRTPQIVDTLVKTATQAAIAAARAGQFDEAAAGDSADLQFDPFNPHELKRINAGLRRFGLCVYVEDHSFDQQAIPAEYWCSDPAQDRYVNPFNMTLAMAPVDPETRGKGILYRPNKTHNIVVRRKVDLARDRWSLYMTKRMEMPNVSPVLLLGVERAVFTKRTTTLKFNNGVLTNVSIDKASELEAFVTIPLKIAQAVVELPAQIVQFRLVDIKGEGDLLTAQGNLINALKSYQDIVSPPAAQTVGSGADQLLAACLQTNADVGACRSAVLPRARVLR